MHQIILRAIHPVAGITEISDVLSHSAVTVADKAAYGVIRQADDKLRLRFSISFEAINTNCLVASKKENGRKILINIKEVDEWIIRNFEPPQVVKPTVFEKSPESLKPYEAAFKIGVSESYIYKKNNSGELPSFRENGNLRINVDDLARWIDS